MLQCGLRPGRLRNMVTWRAWGAYLHETREGGEHIDGGVDLPVVQLAVNVDLALCDVPRQVRDGMSDICSHVAQPQAAEYCIDVDTQDQLCKTLGRHHLLRVGDRMT